MSYHSGDVERRLDEAEIKLCQALHRIHALRRAALYGNYDPTEFDKAVMAYRQADEELRQARAECFRVPAPPPPPPAPVPSARAQSQDEAFEPTPLLRFYKWLVETGRLSDWR